VSGRVTGVASSPTRGVFKTKRSEATLVADRGVEGDYHARGGERQVSLLRQETLDALRAAHGVDVGPGDLGENLTIAGIDLDALPRGARLAVGDDVLVEVTEPREPCRNVERVGRGFLAALEGRAGILARVVRGGTVRTGDVVRVVPVTPGNTES
jgi:MOSC domain-containing protein YiiM